ncbi:helix-turn-helix domain-containing protein [Kordia sp.]|uniref:helix-turn-helix domain-containing protein n=1 Tax=Kordia sp. TaxID=1965332 RepID=UPI003B5C0452
MMVETAFFDGFMSALLFIAFIHGIIIASLLFFNKRLHATSNSFLALSLSGISMQLLYELISYTNPYWNVLKILEPLPIFLSTTVTIGLYFFVKYLINPQYQLKPWEKWWLFPIILQALLCLLYIPFEYIHDIKVFAIALEFLPFAEEFVGLAVSVFLIPLALHHIKHYQEFITSNYSTIDQKSLLWLLNFLRIIFVLVFLWLLSYVIWALGYTYETIYTYVTLGMVVVLFWIGYFVIQKYHLFEIVTFTEHKTSKGKSKKKLSTKTNTYYTELLKLFEEKHLYENIDLTLNELAQHLQLSSGYLSQIINEKEQKSFFEFVNFYRVEAVKRKLLDQNYAHYDIFSIALESGFKSKSTFNAVFKKMTQQTPSAYKKKYS